MALAMAGRIWPAGRSLETPGRYGEVYDRDSDLQLGRQEDPRVDEEVGLRREVHRGDARVGREVSQLEARGARPYHRHCQVTRRPQFLYKISFNLILTSVQIYLIFIFM